VLVTRASDGHARALKKAFPGAQHNPRARTVRLGKPDEKTLHPGLRGARVEVLTAGTSDIPVAEEALETLAAFGCPAKSRYDLGVAGLHRILGHVPAMQSADALIVCAGMEGALPSVVGGLVTGPVVAVPTSVGYGAGFNGLAALLGMLNTCASGVSVVNIDNGFGAAMAVLRMLRLRAPRTEGPGTQDGSRTPSVNRARPRSRRPRNGGKQ
jgi:NCAIR mutase (PurE)-related protein